MTSTLPVLNSTPPPEMAGWQFYKPLRFLTISLIDTFVRCPRKFFYSYGCHLEPAAGPHAALKFGEAIHKALPIITSGPDPLAAYPKAVEAFESVWAGADEDDKRNTFTARRILMDFVQQHLPGRSLYNIIKPPNLLGGKKLSDVSDYEIPFALSLPGVPVPLIGRIDGLARHRDSKELWGLEYKTASESSARLLKAFDWNPQLLCYTLALRVGLTEQIQGMMVETLKVSKTSCETMLKPVYVLSTELDEFVKWLSFQCQLILMHEKVKDFPKQRTGCTSYPMFGMPGFMCDFEAACSGPDWTVFKSLYKVGQGHLPFDLGEIEKLTAADAKPVEVTEEMLTEALKSGV
jgi:hypothetical protein